MTTDFAAAGCAAGFAGAATACGLAATGAAGFAGACGAGFSLLGTLIPLGGAGCADFLAGVATVVGSLWPSSAVTNSCPEAKRSSGFLDSAFMTTPLTSSVILL